LPHDLRISLDAITDMLKILTKAVPNGIARR